MIGSRIVALKVMLADGAPARVPVQTVVDATGNCDIAAATGEKTEFITSDELSLQGAAFTRKKLGASYLNLDWTFIDDCDAEDLWYLSLRGRNSYQRDGRFWDQSQVIDSRERRRLFGLFRVTPQDVMLKRTYPDIVCITRSNFDTHGQTVDPQFLVKSTEHAPLSVNLPYRAAAFMFENFSRGTPVVVFEGDDPLPEEQPEETSSSIDLSKTPEETE